MRKLLLVPISVLLLFCGASNTKTPAPVDAKKHDETYRLMVIAYDAQLRYYSTVMSNASLSDLIAAQQAKEKALTTWQAMVSQLQRESHAESCTLAIDLTWSCPVPPAKK